MAFPSSAADKAVYTTSDGRTYIYSLTKDTWDFQGFVNSAPKQNLAAITPPTVTDDVNSSYSIGSIWVDTLANRAYTCVDNTAGAAIWTVNGATVAASFPTSPTLGQITLNTTDGRAYIWNGTAWIDVTAAGGAMPLNNFSATTDPLVTSDAAAGYSVGSVWINNTTNAIFRCTNVTNGAAIWHDLRSIGDGQTWTNVLASRALGTIYTNTSKRPITVSVTINNTAAVLGNSAMLTIGGINIFGGTLNSPVTLPASVSVTAVVPVGATYSASYSGVTAGVTPIAWSELI